MQHELNRAPIPHPAPVKWSANSLYVLAFMNYEEEISIFQGITQGFDCFNKPIDGCAELYNRNSQMWIHKLQTLDLNVQVARR